MTHEVAVEARNPRVLREMGGGYDQVAKSVVVCIPALNEEASIAKVIVRARKHSDAILVCDDGSTDMTGEIAAALGARVIRHGETKGKGVALRSLISRALQLEPGIVVTLDGDMQHDPSEIPALVDPVRKGEADVVIGTRRMKDGRAPLHRILGNKFLDIVTNMKSGKKVNDSQSGFRAYSARALGQIPFSQKGLTVESQTLIDAIGAGLTIREVPVSTTYEGIKRKRNPAGHLAEIFDYLFSRTLVDKPLVYLGLPGLVIAALGLAAGIRVLDIFLVSNQIAVGTGLVSVILAMVGSVMFSTALILKFLKVHLSG